MCGYYRRVHIRAEIIITDREKAVDISICRNPVLSIDFFKTWFWNFTVCILSILTNSDAIAHKKLQCLCSICIGYRIQLNCYARLALGQTWESYGLLLSSSNSRCIYWVFFGRALNVNVNGTRFYRALESVSIASALSSALTTVEYWHTHTLNDCSSHCRLFTFLVDFKQQLLIISNSFT